MKFYKMHGLGNDFVVIDGFVDPDEVSAKQAQAWCDRRTGIGADGVIIVRPGKDDADGFMDYINADGSLAQMCGNGVRVTAKFLYDHGYIEADARTASIQTRAGVRHVTFEVDSGELSVATVNMGAPIVEPGTIPIAPAAGAKSTAVTNPVFSVDSPWGEVILSAVSMGNPHAVWFIDDLEALDASLFPATGPRQLATMNIGAIGAYLEAHEYFPEKTNVEFVVITDEGLDMRVFERGVGETSACGTGACAVAVAAQLAGHAGRNVAVHLPGGTLDISWDEDDGEVYMTGAAATVFEGNLTKEGQ